MVWEYASIAWEYARMAWEYARMACEYARMAWEYARMACEYARMAWEYARTAVEVTVLVEDTFLPATAPNYVHSQCVVEHGRDEADECLIDAALKLQMIDGDASIRLVVAVHNKAWYLGCGEMTFHGLNA
ncbi:hypothetical protein DFP73DRAFT_592870 [Morchella snyderi]|nr:hypothetical protein DFP73DRAFT_592870 [Morchella snyderi]